MVSLDTVTGRPAPRFNVETSLSVRKRLQRDSSSSIRAQAAATRRLPSPAVTTTTWASLPIARRRAWVTPGGDAHESARVAGGISLPGWW